MWHWGYKKDCVGKKYEIDIENNLWKLCWDFKYHLCKTTARRSDVTIEYKNKNKISLIDMACPSENNVDAKHAEKLQKYQWLAFKIRQKQLEYNVMIIPIINGCLGGGMRRVTNQTGQLISDIRRKENKSDIELKWWRQYYLKEKV